MTNQPLDEYRLQFDDIDIDYEHELFFDLLHRMFEYDQTKRITARKYSLHKSS